MIDIAFVYFRAVTLQHLDAAWFSLAQQDFTDVRGVFFLDNNTADDPHDILEVLHRYPLPVPLHLSFQKHGDATKTQSWSVNTVCQQTTMPWIFFSRADYILDASCLQKFRRLAYGEHPSVPPFVTSYAYHMAYDERGDQRIEGFRDIEQHEWRTLGAQVLLETVNGWRVGSSDQDAGVWLARRRDLARAGWMDERLSSWGYQQTIFQRAIRDQGTPIAQIPEFLFFHQHHAAARSYDVARQELEQHWGTVEKLHDFRDIAGHHGSVCDELDKP